jgi:hypothetical protein
MWLFTTQGFYSVGAHRDGPAKVIGRARARGDLEALKEQIPTLRIFEDPDADYRYRTVVAHEQWVAAAAILAAGINHDNFESAVGDRQGLERERVYARVSGEMLELQNR